MRLHEVHRDSCTMFLGHVGVNLQDSKQRNVQHNYNAKPASRMRTDETRAGGHSKALKSKEKIKTNVVMIMITASHVKSITPTPCFQQSKDRDHQG